MLQTSEPMSSSPSNRIASVPNSSESDDVGPEEVIEKTSEGMTGCDCSPQCSPITDAEATALRQERLLEIRKAVESGAYDSDELLELAMNRMRQAVEREQKPQ